MALPTAVGGVLLFHAVLVLLVAVSVATVSPHLARPSWVDAPEGQRRWVAEARSMTHDVQRTLAAGETLPYDTVQRRLLPLSSRLDRHAELAPVTVDTDLVVAVTRLAIGCRVVGMELTRAQRLDWAAPGSEVAAVAAVADELSTALSPTE